MPWGKIRRRVTRGLAGLERVHRSLRRFGRRHEPLISETHPDERKNPVESLRAREIARKKELSGLKKAYAEMRARHQDREFFREFNRFFSQMPRGFRNSIDANTRIYAKLQLRRAGFTPSELKSFFLGLQRLFAEKGIPRNPKEFLREHVNTIIEHLSQAG